MTKNPPQIPLEPDIRQQAARLFEALGLDMSSAIELFLRQCVQHGGLPFHIDAAGTDLTEEGQKSGTGKTSVSPFGIARGEFVLPPDYLDRSESLDREISDAIYGEAQ